MNKIALSLMLGLAVAASGCGKDEVTGTDAGADAALSDIGAQDTSSASDSGNTTDDTGSRPDAAGADTGNSGDDAGATGDAGSEDTGVADMASTDMGGSADMAAGPCATGYTAHEEVAGAVVACEGAADSLNQCDAAAACGAGWHMCTAAEYRTYFETVEPAAVADASYWLASCIRDGAATTAPSGMVCSDCTGTQTGGNVEVSFSCINALTIETNQLYVGVRAGSACTFTGLDEAGNDAFWNAQPASALQAGAFCCID